MSMRYPFWKGGLSGRPSAQNFSNRTALLPQGCLPQGPLRSGLSVPKPGSLGAGTGHAWPGHSQGQLSSTPGGRQHQEHGPSVSIWDAPPAPRCHLCIRTGSPWQGPICGNPTTSAPSSAPALQALASMPRSCPAVLQESCAPEPPGPQASSLRLGHCFPKPPRTHPHRTPL